MRVGEPVSAAQDGDHREGQMPTQPGPCLSCPEAALSVTCHTSDPAGRRKAGQIVRFVRDTLPDTARISDNVSYDFSKGLCAPKRYCHWFAVMTRIFHTVSWNFCALSLKCSFFLYNTYMAWFMHVSKSDISTTRSGVWFSLLGLRASFSDVTSNK